MNFIVNRQDLLAAAQDAEKIAPAASPLEVLKCTLLSAAEGKLTVAATSLELALERRIKADISEEGSVIVDARLLCGMLRLLEDEFVTFTREGTTLRVSGGSSVYSVSVSDEKDYPRVEIPFPADTVPVTGIPSMAKRTVFAVAEEFARVEGILPAPESSHAILTAINEAKKCRETGEEKTILFGLTGTGYFDLVAYEKFHDGKMSNFVPSDEEISQSLAQLPEVH